jgi:hypothetical protein
VPIYGLSLITRKLGPDEPAWERLRPDDPCTETTAAQWSSGTGLALYDVGEPIPVETFPRMASMMLGQQRVRVQVPVDEAGRQLLGAAWSPVLMLEDGNSCEVFDTPDGLRCVPEQGLGVLTLESLSSTFADDGCTMPLVESASPGAVFFIKADIEAAPGCQRLVAAWKVGEARLFDEAWILDAGVCTSALLEGPISFHPLEQTEYAGIPVTIGVAPVP